MKFQPFPPTFSLPSSPARRALLCALTLPCSVYAVQIGEVVSLSKLGSPLRVEVAISTAENEQLDRTCLSLVTPDSKTEDASSYLSRVKLTLKTEGTQQRVIISSPSAFNEAYAKFHLQVQCHGIGSISKTFTILPDIDELEAAPELASMPANNDAPIVVMASEPSEPSAVVTVITHPTPPKNIVRKVAPSVRKTARHPAAQSSKHSSDHFHLKLSGDPLDASRIGKISDADREFLLARQKLLDADDQMASFLALQHQVKQLQEELGDMKLKLAQLNVAPARIQPTTVSTPQNTPVTQIPNQPEQSNTRGWLKPSIVLGLLMAAMLTVLFALRRYKQSKLQSHWEAENEAEMARNTAPFVPAVPIHIAQPSALVTPVPPPSVAPPADIVTPAPTQNLSDTPDEIDSIIEEAQLYAVHNHPKKAVQILQEVLAEHPEKSEGWLLLLSIFSSQSKAAKFEESARAFLKHNRDEASWKVIQALGRTLEPDHPLYANEGDLIASHLSPDSALGNRRPIGDVLVDMGALSTEDMQNCLNDFDPKLHGRFGGYLVTRKVITHAQLSNALVYQQKTQPALADDVLRQAEPMLEYAPEPATKPLPDLEFETEIDWHGIDVLLKSDKR